MSQIIPKLLTPEATLSLDLSGIKLIEASAGTGKTYTISNLFCRFIIEGKAIQNILLVTFTNAATDELKERIRQRLHQVLSLFKNEQTKQHEDVFLQRLVKEFQVKDEVDQALIQQRLLLAIRSFDETAIHTINGFCQRMLGDYAFHSAQHFELNLIQNDKNLWKTAIKDWWRQQSYTLSSSHYALFMESVSNIERITKHSEDIRSESSIKIIPDNNQSLSELYKLWDEHLQALNHIKTLWEQHKNVFNDFIHQHKIFKKNRVHAEDKIEQHVNDLNAFLNSSEVILPKAFEVICYSKIISNTLNAHLDKTVFFDADLYHLADALLHEQQSIIKKFTISSILAAHDYAKEETAKAKYNQNCLTFNDQLTFLHEALNQPNSQLANSINEQFPIALIDEFQDTNALQYSIFEHIYQTKENISLLMIGDPKQAIYSFRGGDIFTYIKAKKHVNDELYSLNSNWRSTPKLIHATNHLFTQRNDAFIYSDDMPFEEVLAGKDNQSELIRNNETQHALSLWHISDDHDSATAAALTINQHVSNEISQLLNEGHAKQAMINGKPIKPSDIAILVRNNFEGKAIATALKQRGIHSINIGKDKVLQSDAARGLLLLLTGIVQSDNQQAIRNMLASRLLMFSPEKINSLVNNESKWIEWLSVVNKLNELWLQDGFIVMFYSMLRLLNITQSVAQHAHAERQMTNLLHCAEIIQQQAKTQATPLALCHWLHQQINDPELSNNDEDELRLESDAQLVKIVTVHKSKGLEYPIVFVPYLWRAKAKSATAQYYQYHDSQQQAVLDFINEEKQAYIQADKERLAEDMRLLYVAITRAKSKCYLVTGQVARTQSQHSALAFLCHHHQSSGDLNSKTADIKPYQKKNDLLTDLKNIAALSDNTIDVSSLLPTTEIIPYEIPNEKNALLEAEIFKGKLNVNWQISSFSRMTRDIHQVAHGGHIQPTNDAIFNFKRGGDAGTFLHHILECLDFSGDIKSQSESLFQRFSKRYHLDGEENLNVVIQWMLEIVNTSINTTGFCLAHLKPEKRLDELAFDFSLDGVDIKALNTFLNQRTGQSGSQLTISNFKGMMTGYIDLVYETNGQYFIVDYKSNYLGNQLVDYQPEKLNQAIIDRRYDLQYLLYSLALHRYLRYRLSNYNYEDHFGGAYYLFLRGMRKKTGDQFGVFYDKPTLKEMDELDTLLFKSAESCYE